MTPAFVFSSHFECACVAIIKGLILPRSRPGRPAFENALKVGHIQRAEDAQPSHKASRLTWSLSPKDTSVNVAELPNDETLFRFPELSQVP